MWLFTRYGFFSVVCARQGDGHYGEPIDPDRLMVRARVHQHLDALKTRFPDLLSGCEIQQFPGSDYAHRLFVAKSTWATISEALSQELDYDNFKSEVSRFQGRGGAAYVQALHKVWSVMYGIQDRD